MFKNDVFIHQNILIHLTVSVLVDILVVIFFWSCKHITQHVTLKYLILILNAIWTFFLFRLNLLRISCLMHWASSISLPLSLSNTQTHSHTHTYICVGGSFYSGESIEKPSIIVWPSADIKASIMTTGRHRWTISFYMYYWGSWNLQTL